MLKKMFFFFTQITLYYRTKDRNIIMIIYIIAKAVEWMSRTTGETIE